MFFDDVYPRRLTIFENGKSKHVIVIPSVATDIEQQAALKLQQYLNEILGAELKIVPENKSGNTHNIFIGKCSAAKALDIDFLVLGKDGV